MKQLSTQVLAKHRIPWNAVYWGVILVLAGGAFAFGVGVQLKRSGRFIFEDAKLKDGDSVRVVLILNGDELLVDKGGHRGRLRMLGIRSFDPVVNERQITNLGEGAIEFLNRYTSEKDVKVIFDKPIIDEHGRYLAYLEVDGIDVNHLMVEQGVSMVLTEYPFARETDYLITESLARSRREGIWRVHKATTRIEALRREWAKAREKRTGKLPPDYLLGVLP
ncbi:MAG: hypothetical protein A2289_03440 [Deltaproteobacteria bacterium RIFOXYA12_FULL_58_15]|nr:MAG: hypothetical protein A2289_03440 [Deltaproteobacteria bacterium RIFOXYA12_FULL_58_15]OGR14240.1 MAG: hypothetical protein A2341_13535 [Deltaproteobacteria bacterium RIFOXYB12_FULL_58_9]